MKQFSLLYSSTLNATIIERVLLEDSAIAQLIHAFEPGDEADLASDVTIACNKVRFWGWNNAQIKAQVTSRAVRLCQEVLLSPVAAPIEQLPRMTLIWEGDTVGQASASAQLPSYAHEPQAYVTKVSKRLFRSSFTKRSWFQIGQYLMSLAHHITEYSSAAVADETATRVAMLAAPPPYLHNETETRGDQATVQGMFFYHCQKDEILSQTSFVECHPLKYG